VNAVARAGNLNRAQLRQPRLKAGRFFGCDEAARLRSPVTNRAGQRMLLISPRQSMSSGPRCSKKTSGWKRSFRGSPTEPIDFWLVGCVGPLRGE